MRCSKTPPVYEEVDKGTSVSWHRYNGLRPVGNGMMSLATRFETHKHPSDFKKQCHPSFLANATPATRSSSINAVSFSSACPTNLFVAAIGVSNPDCLDFSVEVKNDVLVRPSLKWTQ